MDIVQPRHPHHDEDIAHELEPFHMEDRADGPGGAAMLAAGIGVFALGLFTTLAEISGGFKTFLESFDFTGGVGPLAGKTILAVIVWLIAWVGFGTAWRSRDVELRPIFMIGLVLGLLGAVGTFPLFFEMFAE